MRTRDAQRTLFELETPGLEAAPAQPEHRALAAELPSGVRLGGMSWSYPGWRGSVYAKQSSPKVLAERGLGAYARHPLFRAVEIDRTYYEPLAVLAFTELAAEVPDDFRFLVKAHEDCTVRRFPVHARYGRKRGETNPLYLDASYATDAVVAPVLAGLGPKLGALLFQFSPRELSDGSAFVEDLHDFLRRLPKGVTYAVEIRNPELLTAEYATMLAASGAVHCHNVWTTMPSVLAQARQIVPSARNPLIVRWLLRHGTAYEDASERFAPFDHLALEDLENREQIARLVIKAEQHGVPALILVDNKAEGSAPESIVRLARTLSDGFRQRNEHA